MNFAGIIFDFDGVLIESEDVSNRHLAALLSGLGHPTSVAQAADAFTGLSGSNFRAAVERWIGRSIPPEFHTQRAAEDARVLAEGIPAVTGAIAFVRALPASLPRAIASSSSTRWIETHLAHIGLADNFAGMIFSGREHVARGKPAPDIYLHAAATMGVAIDRTLILEDSSIGAQGAVASGATVVGLCTGSHCAVDHGERLRTIGVHRIANDFAAVAHILGI